MSKFIRFYPLGIFGYYRMRKSELPGDVVCRFDKYLNCNIYLQVPPKPPRPIFELSRGGTGRCKLGERGTMLRYWNDKQWRKSPWQHIAKLHWRHSGKAKRYAHRTARRKAKILLQCDPEGDTNFRAQFGLTNWAFS